MKIVNCSINEFVKQYKDRVIVAFGMGTELISFSNEKREINNQLIQCFDYVVDNDKSKVGNTILLGDRSFKIMSIDNIIQKKIEKPVFLITCMAYLAIMKQLDSIDEFKDAECFYLMCMKESPELDLDWFIKNEISKDAIVSYRERLKTLGLKNKYVGQRCFVIGNGPSLSPKDLDKLRGEISFASNLIYNIYDQTDWRPTFYVAIDYLFFTRHKGYREKNGAKYFFLPLERAMACQEVFDEAYYYERKTSYSVVENNKITSQNVDIPFSDDMEKCIYGGETVTYDLIQMAVYMGFSQIYLLGVDHTIFQNGGHFYKGEIEDANCINGDALMDAAYLKVKQETENRRIEVINATRGGRLEIFRRADLDFIL